MKAKRFDIARYSHHDGVHADRARLTEEFRRRPETWATCYLVSWLATNNKSYRADERKAWFLDLVRIMEDHYGVSSGIFDEIEEKGQIVLDGMI